MEGVQEITTQTNIEGVKTNTASDLVSTVSADEVVCHKSNGVSETSSALESAAAEGPTTVMVSVDDSPSAMPVTTNDNEGDIPNTATTGSEGPTADIPEANNIDAEVEHLLDDNKTSEEIIEEIVETTETVLTPEKEVIVEETVMTVDNVDAVTEKVQFNTVILVEKNDSEHNEKISEGYDAAHNILNELGPSIGLSEALRSSDTTENVENNHCNSGVEVFNNEELLDILQGNDGPPVNKISEVINTTDLHAKKIIEAQMALKQLTRLKTGKKVQVRVRNKSISERKTRRKRGEKITENINSENPNNVVEKTDLGDNINNTNTEAKSLTPDKNKNDSIVNVLVKDWDDDDPSEIAQGEELLKETEITVETAELLVKSQEEISQDDMSETSTDHTANENQSAVLSKSGDESQPQRRLGRIIKKKVIFDPDNPDTFTKGKTIVKNKEGHSDKETPPPKKTKMDSTPQRSKSKSPMSKLQWKKPSPKNGASKQNKRLTEVDKLLMDEGAVNMIYQLTPEAPKGKKNMRTKAEFIKKIQSSTPEGKEMKFRERKKEGKIDEGEAKKILGGKQRSSLGGSVKSPSVCEDFETHSADDSIIYRRHSSSSYSSTCMSPRRLSDVDSGAVQSVTRSSRHSSTNQNQIVEVANEQPSDIFLSSAKASDDIINKDDCLSIKEKLNKKISLALNKRKRENPKTEKPPKQKRSSKTEDNNESIKVERNSFNYLSITYNQRLAEICIGNPGSNVVELLRELEKALAIIDNLKDISVTLLISECGTLCSSLDLRPLFDDNMERRTNSAFEIAESIRSAQLAVHRHRKLVVAGVWGDCAGVGLALLALSDVALASERASFSVGFAPCVAALTAGCRQLPHSLVNDLVVFGRRLSSLEAAQGGLVSRTVWPGKDNEQMRAVAMHIATQPAQSILLKKQLLCLKKNAEHEITFLSSLEKERDLLVEYWTSVSGQDMLQGNMDAV